jgi:hypothetical protein
MACQEKSLPTPNEAADVAAQEELMARRHRIADPGADYRIEPVDRSRAGERPGATDLEIADVDRTCNVERKVRFLVPVAGATKDIEGERP